MAFSLLRDLIDLLDKKSKDAESKLKFKPLVEGLGYATTVSSLGEKIYHLRFTDREMLSFSRSLIAMFLNEDEFEENLHDTFAGIYLKLDVAEKSPKNEPELELSEDEMVDFFGLFEELEDQEGDLSPEEMANLNNIHNLMYDYQLMEKNMSFAAPVF